MSLIDFTRALHDSTLTATQKHNSFQTFLTYFTQLKTDVLKRTTYTDKQLSEHIFRNTWKEKDGDLMLKKRLFAAYNTLDRLNTIITVTNFSQYEFLLKMLGYDLYEIVLCSEANYRNTQLNFQLGSRADQNAREVFDISNVLFHIGALSPSNFYLREVVPVSVFLIRQTIEVYGKRTLGFYAITDENENRVKSISPQVAWDFFKYETLKDNSRVNLPVHIDIIQKIEAWTNYYVHTGNIPDVFLIENAIHLSNL